MSREQKITFGEMRESGVFRIDVFCSDYRCSHSTTLPADRWPDHARLSDIEPQFFCKACGWRRYPAGLPTLEDGSRPEVTVWICDQDEELKVFATEEVGESGSMKTSGGRCLRI